MSCHRKPRTSPRRIPVVIAEEEVKKFLAHSQESRYHIGYLLAITTGMRLGEVIVTVCFSKSMSCHRKPRTSPRRIPVVIASRYPM
jgi:hypothetical protein